MKFGIFMPRRGKLGISSKSKLKSAYLAVVLRCKRGISRPWHTKSVLGLAPRPSPISVRSEVVFNLVQLRLYCRWSGQRHDSAMIKQNVKRFTPRAILARAAARREEARAKSRAVKAPADAVLLAAELIGSDGLGKGGVVGYLSWVARNYPKTFARLLVQVLVLEARQGSRKRPPRVASLRTVDMISSDLSVGPLCRIAVKEPRTFAKLLGQVMVLQERQGPERAD